MGGLIVGVSSPGAWVQLPASERKRTRAFREFAQRWARHHSEGRCDVAVGRPREFDSDQVEAGAMKLFSERGFDGVSISDVTAATGVNRRSIYAEFGSKDKLFERAAERYLYGPGDYMTAAALARLTAREVAEAMVRSATASCPVSTP